MKSSFTRRALIQSLAETFAQKAGQVAQRTPARDSGEDQTHSYSQLWSRAARLAAALRTLGVRSGQPVLLLSENRDAWLVADLALLGLGAPSVPRGTEAPAAEIAYISGKVRARTALLEHAGLLDRLPRDASRPDRIVLLSGEAPRDSATPVLTLEQCLAEQDEAAALVAFERDIHARDAGETATIVFTSGTTGQPKGVVLTQANLAANLHQAVSTIDFVRPDGRYLALLPPWHMFERLVEYALLTLGYELVYSSRRTFAADLVEFPPDVLCAVPRLWIALMDGVLGKVAKAPPARRRLFQLARWSARSVVRARRLLHGRLPRFANQRSDGLARRSWTIARGGLAWPLARVLDRVVWAKVRERLGLSRVPRGAAISGGGSLPDHVDEFFECLGIDLLERLRADRDVTRAVPAPPAAQRAGHRRPAAAADRARDPRPGHRRRSPRRIDRRGARARSPGHAGLLRGRRRDRQGARGQRAGSTPATSVA